MESRPISALPRSVVLALWLGSWIGARPNAEAMVRAQQAIEADDEPHTLVTANENGFSGDALSGQLLRELLASIEVTDVRALLPIPGDGQGIPAAVTAAAIEAGECILLSTRDGHWAVVPTVTRFGSDLEPGHQVRWRATAIEPWQTAVHAEVGSPAQADADLRSALLTATTALRHLDVARWGPEDADVITRLATLEIAPGILPSAPGPWALRLLPQAMRLRAIIRLARTDDGGAVNPWQADQRSAALQQIDGAARRALSAATTPSRR